ncbi:MAG: carbon monoxide dehydrogenase subunit G [Gemmatimonadota bacterium]|nr:carbon monoxide dehydrogenase subunit G [Gemmatimonadota bacterium]
MKIEGEFRFDAPREAVWEALLDPDVIARTIPGTERLDRVAEDRYGGVMKVGVGPVSGRFDLDVTIAEKRSPESFSMDVSGRGPLGHATGVARVELDDEDGGTRMRYASDLSIGGRIAGVGQRMIDTVARSMAQKGLQSLEAEIERRTGAP